MDKQETPCTTNPDLWFSEGRVSTERAKSLCQTCPHIVPCRELGKDEEFGVWGGVEAPGRDASARKAKRNAEILALHNEGHSYSAIGRLIKVDFRTVRNAILHAA